MGEGKGARNGFLREISDIFPPLPLCYNNFLNTCKIFGMSFRLTRPFMTFTINFTSLGHYKYDHGVRWIFFSIKTLSLVKILLLKFSFDFFEISSYFVKFRFQKNSLIEFIQD